MCSWAWRKNFDAEIFRREKTASNFFACQKFHAKKVFPEKNSHAKNPMPKKIKTDRTGLRSRSGPSKGIVP